MDEFIYKAPYEEEGKRILEVNILPETYCSFNCIYCPIDRKEDRHQTDEIQDLGDVTKALDDLGRRMEEERIEEVFLNGHGESLLHQALPRIIDFIHQKELPCGFFQMATSCIGPSTRLLPIVVRPLSANSRMLRMPVSKKSAAPFRLYLGAIYCQYESLPGAVSRPLHL